MKVKTSKDQTSKSAIEKTRATKHEVKEATQRGIKHYMNTLKELSRR